MNRNRQIRFCAIDLRGHLRQLFTVKWHNGSFYYIDPLSLRGNELKFSYHALQGDGLLARTHLKIQGRELTNMRAHRPPLEQLTGLTFLGGGSCRLHELHLYPKPKTGHGSILHPLPINAASHYRHYLSTLEWQAFLLEPGNLVAWESHPMIKAALASRFSEPLGFFFYKDCRPWLVVEFTRLRVEVPIWLEGLDASTYEATIRSILWSLPESCFE